MNTATTPQPGDALSTFYADALRLLERTGVPFLIGGAFAHSRYTGRDRETKDLDVLLRRTDVRRALAAFAAHGYETRLPFPHWLGKIYSGGFFIDVVFGSGNGVVRVDDTWFPHAVSGEVLGELVPLCPPEELLWSNAFVQERERFDGAAVLHLLHACAATLDWDRLLARFGDHWPVLLSHLLLFHYAYPDRRDMIPRPVMQALLDRADRLRAEPDNHLCRGTLLSREQFLFDVEELGYEDARVRPHGRMTEAETAIWTDAIESRE